MGNFVTDPSSIPSGLSEAVNIDLSRNGTPPPMPGEFEQPPAQPAQSAPAPAPSFADIDGFASGSELAEAVKDPSRLQSLIKERVGRLYQSVAQEREQAEHFRNLMIVPEMRDHILAKLEGRQEGAPQQRRQPQPSDEIAALRAELRQLKGEYQAQTKGQREVQEFASSHPDLPQFVPAMQRIMQENPGTSLALAYRLAKFEAGSIAGSRASSPPVSERPTAGVGPASQNDVVAALSAQARDRGRFRTMEDAFAHVARQTGAYQE